MYGNQASDGSWVRSMSSGVLMAALPTPHLKPSPDLLNLLALWPGAGYFTSLNHSFLIYLRAIVRLCMQTQPGTQWVLIRGTVAIPSSSLAQELRNQIGPHTLTHVGFSWVFAARPPLIPAGIVLPTVFLQAL